MLRDDHRVMASQGIDDGLFLYKVDAGNRFGDTFLRVARNFGLMEDKWLTPTALHAVATSACKALTENQMQSIRRGVALYERILTMPVEDASALNTNVLNGKASYVGLYTISRGRFTAPVAGGAAAVGEPVTLDDANDAKAFIDACVILLAPD